MKTYYIIAGNEKYIGTKGGIVNYQEDSKKFKSYKLCRDYMRAFDQETIQKFNMKINYICDII